MFAHGAYEFSDALELEVGARYSDYKMDQKTEWLFNLGASPPEPGLPLVFPFPGASDGGDEQDLSEDSVDWQVALNWTVNPDQFLYGLISRGHVTGGINLFPNPLLTPTFFPYSEMEVINYEAGWKSTWADDQFRTQFTVYYETFDDYQANFADQTGALNNPALRNAETESTIWGAELSAQAQVGNFRMDFGAAYLDSELGDFSNVVDPFTGEFTDLTGARAPFSPEFTGNIGLAYDIPIGSFYLTPRVDVAHTGETQAALWDSPMVTLEERTLVNGLLTFAPESNNWKVEAWITNAGDKQYIAGIQNNATLFYAAPPRQYGLRGTYNF